MRLPCGCLDVYLCSRCNQCYRCRHKLVYFEQQDKYMWKNRKGKFEPVILEAFRGYENQEERSSDAEMPGLRSEE